MSAPAQIAFDLRALVQRNNGRARLRTLFADGRWHAAAELAHVAGRRYGARIFELRRGADGLPPLYVQAAPRCQGDGEWVYRRVPAPECEGRRCGAECDPMCQLAGGLP